MELDDLKAHWQKGNDKHVEQNKKNMEELTRMLNGKTNDFIVTVRKKYEKIISIITAPLGWRLAFYDSHAKEVFYCAVGAWALVENSERFQDVRPLVAFADSSTLEPPSPKTAPSPILVPPGHTASWNETHGLTHDQTREATK